MRKKIAKISALAGLSTVSVAQAFAQAGTIKVTQLDKSVGISDIGKLISAAFQAAILMAAIFVFAMLIQGGYTWISAGGDKSKVEEARTRITNALIGLAIVAAAWALMTIIGKFFGVSIDNINIPSATGTL